MDSAKNYDHIRQLIVRHILGELSPEGEARLDEWRRENPMHEDYFRKICDEPQLAEKMELYTALNTEKALAVNRTLLRRRVSRRRLVRLSGYVAAAVAVTAIVLFSMNLGESDSDRKDPIPAGRKYAELVLTDGRTVMLEEDIDTEVDDGGSVIRVVDNTILYDDAVPAELMNSHTVRTPHGSEYIVTLSDGSKVWLNAMSELHYPRSFTGDAREVRLTGEAYFEVVPGDRPFIVSAGDCSVTVLGTSFNITAYPEESHILTTLCTGRVEVGDNADEANRLAMQPGYQLSFDRSTRRMGTRQVDIDVYTAWTKGKFQFDNNTVEEVFNIIGRWYDIEVIYRNEEAQSEVFTAVLPRFADLRMILEMMEKVSDLKFTTKGNTVYVM